MKSVITIIVMSIFTTVIAGCAGNPYKADNKVSLSPHENMGVVVVTLNTSGVPKGFHYVIQNETNDITLSVPEYGFSESMLPMLMSDFEEIKGKLVVLRLPEGKYRFTEWYNITGSQYGSHELRSRQGFPIHFEVVANKANYIGELYQKNKYDGIVLVDSRVSIRNEAERDVKLFLEKYPNINETDVIENIAFK